MLNKKISLLLLYVSMIMLTSSTLDADVPWYRNGWKVAMGMSGLATAALWSYASALLQSNSDIEEYGREITVIKDKIDNGTLGDMRAWPRIIRKCYPDVDNQLWRHIRRNDPTQKEKADIKDLLDYSVSSSQKAKKLNSYIAKWTIGLGSVFAMLCATSYYVGVKK